MLQGRHFLGGRFVPPQISQRYKLQLLPYPGSTQVVEIKVGRLIGQSTPDLSPQEIQ